MGQQQILLIVLSVILVGVATSVGINMFNSQAEQSAKDMIAIQLQNMGSEAYQYYIKPASMGGAERDWTKVILDSNKWLPLLTRASTDGVITIVSTKLRIKIKSTYGTLHKGYVDVSDDGTMKTKITQ